jgi:O-antigen ligase
MNGWRQLLIFIGPWALLCALTISIQHRRIFGWLAITAVVNGIAVALSGNLARINKWRDFLGIVEPELNSPPFGPFIYRNHAGAFLCLATSLALALAFYLAKQKGDQVDRGGPHLIIGLAALFLAIGAASTMSFAAVAVAATILVIIGPVAYLLDRKLRNNLSLLPMSAFLALAAVVAYVGLLSIDANRWRYKTKVKIDRMEQSGADDRAPLRDATWMMVESTSFERQLSGWGAGSYRWTSPDFLKTQHEYLNKRGELVKRATHAHNDWLQSLVEWGLAGWVIVIGTLAFLGLRLRAQLRRPNAPAIALLGGLVAFSSHAFLDFLTFIPQMTLLGVMVAWLLVLEQYANGPE